MQLNRETAEWQREKLTFFLCSLVWHLLTLSMRQNNIVYYNRLEYHSTEFDCVNNLLISFSYLRCYEAQVVVDELDLTILCRPYNW